MLTAFLGPQTDREKLIAFYKKVRPFGPGWKKIRQEAGISEAEAKATCESFPLALVGWVSGSLTIWSALFAVGNFIYGRMTYAFILTAVFLASGTALIMVMNRLWPSGKATSKMPTAG